MKIINLYGHLTVDRIFFDTGYRETLGGIANVWDSLMKLNGKTLINMQPTSIGEAIIVVNIKKTEKVGRAILNKTIIQPRVMKADWNHLAYINQIPNIDIEFINKLSGIISADITKECPENCVPYLSMIDYLFISKEDLFDDVIEIGKKTKGWVIAHDSHGSICSNGEETYEYALPNDLYLEDVNVLGAGDSFAAAFIIESFKNNDVKEIIENSHINTTELIKIKQHE
jgi:sugar/nucleoside kinase (ribokinase family)